MEPKQASVVVKTKTSMRRSTRGLLLLPAILPLTVLTFSLLYMLGEHFLEHRDRDFWSSLEWAAETLTTTGYGADSHWDHPLMVALVVLAQFSGLFLVFHYSPAVAGLIEEFRRFKRRFVILERDREEARAAQERGLPVMYLDTDESSLPPNTVHRLAAVVLNDSDQDNAAVTMMLREEGFEGPILAFVQTPLHRLPLQQLGATAVYTPKHLLAAALATRASRWLTARVRNVQELGRDVGVFKLRITRSSPLAGQTLREANLRQLGVTIVGIWSGGLFSAVPRPSTERATGSVLVAVGSHRALEGVDIVGNVLDPDILDAIRAQEPRAIILAIGNDAETQFLAAVVRESLPEVPLMARVNQSHSVDRLHRLGVDYALSIDSVAGELLATQLLGEEYVDVEPELRVGRVRAAGLTGEHPWQLGELDRFGCKVVALARSGEVMVSFDANFRIQDDDHLFLCGRPEELDAYLDQHPEAQPQQTLKAATA